MLDEQARLEIGWLAARELVEEHEAEHNPVPLELTDDVRAFLAVAGPTATEQHELCETG